MCKFSIFSSHFFMSLRWTQKILAEYLFTEVVFLYQYILLSLFFSVLLFVVYLKIFFFRILYLLIYWFVVSGCADRNISSLILEYTANIPNIMVRNLLWWLLVIFIASNIKWPFKCNALHRSELLIFCIIIFSNNFTK